MIKIHLNEQYSSPYLSVNNADVIAAQDKFNYELVNNNMIDVEAFHKGYDQVLIDPSMLGQAGMDQVYAADGTLVGRGVYGILKTLDSKSPNKVFAKAAKAAKEYWARLYGVNYATGNPYRATYKNLIYTSPAANTNTTSAPTSSKTTSSNPDIVYQTIVTMIEKLQTGNTPISKVTFMEHGSDTERMCFILYVNGLYYYINFTFVNGKIKIFKTTDAMIQGNTVGVISSFGTLTQADNSQDYITYLTNMFRPDAELAVVIAANAEYNCNSYNDDIVSNELKQKFLLDEDSVDAAKLKGDPTANSIKSISDISGRAAIRSNKGTFAFGAGINSWSLYER